VLADRERIAQVFSNLIGNALKFTPSGGRVSVRGWRAKTGVRFAVEDTGPGIPPEDQGHVFDRYWQAQNAQMGTGLGLSIAKAIVEGHGGSIRVESTPGQGTRFEFSLPMTGETDGQAEPGTPGAHQDHHWATACRQA
jgi:signal transduction histidine kinase